MSVNLEEYVASIRDFPKEGILFRDVTPMVLDPKAYDYSTDLIAEYGRKVQADLVVGPESRGYIFGCPAAIKLGVGFAPVRKPGKLPRETVSCKYDLEYGSNELFMHKDAVQPGQRVLIVDDLLATGGTAKATAQMIEELGGIVAGFAFVIELYGNGMEGRKMLEGYDVFNILYLSDQ